MSRKYLKISNDISHYGRPRRLHTDGLLLAALVAASTGLAISPGTFMFANRLSQVMLR